MLQLLLQKKQAMRQLLQPNAPLPLLQERHHLRRARRLRQRQAKQKLLRSPLMSQQEQVRHLPESSRGRALLRWLQLLQRLLKRTKLRNLRLPPLSQNERVQRRLLLEKRVLRVLRRVLWLRKRLQKEPVLQPLCPLGSRGRVRLKRHSIPWLRRLQNPRLRKKPLRHARRAVRLRQPEQ